MNHWDPYMNDPFLNNSSHGHEAGRVDNNAPPMAPLPTEAMPTGGMPAGAMPMAYYPSTAPYGYWCPSVAPPAPLVSPAHLDSPDSPNGFDSPDSSDMMPPAPPLGLEAMPNMTHASVWPMGGEKNIPPMTPDGAVASYGMTAPYAENVPPAVGTAPLAVPGTLPGMVVGATPGFIPGAVPYVPLYHPPMMPMPYAPMAPCGYPAAKMQPYYGYGGATPYAPGMPNPYVP
ncbi:hypothetical protein [Geobacillus jurassicus]|uniref:Spore coat protein n=1 Tax=Geobacillus jurassicus TaxID=235932 RepID=A0ABV6GQ24_9BACL|nr:hypothetical protein [Geobacillus jurassicus]